MLVIVLASGAAHVAYRAWWLPSWRSWPSEPFSADKWRSTSENGRHIFWKDLRSRSLLVGAARQDVIDLLGPPSSDAGLYLTYVVKDRDAREYTFNFVYLIQLNLDEAGRVTRAFIRHD